MIDWTKLIQLIVETIVSTVITITNLKVHGHMKKTIYYFRLSLKKDLEVGLKLPKVFKTEKENNAEKDGIIT